MAVPRLIRMGGVPKGLIIRPAVLADAQSLAEGEWATAREPGLLVAQPEEIPLATYAAKIGDLTPDGYYRVAQLEQKIVGHLLLDPGSLKAVGHVLGLTFVVYPGFQNRGIGQALLNDAIGWAKRTAAVEKIELHVRSTNIRAMSLYEKLGFFHEGRRRRRIKLGPDTYLDDVQMGLFT